MVPASAPILLVEDDPNDAFFLEYAFQSAGIENQIRIVVDGHQAIAYFTGEGEFADRQRFGFPCLVLVDLKLPGMSGLDLLRWIRDQPHLQSMLVLVLSSSREARDIDEAYRLGARSYLVKPLSLEERLLMAKAIKAYWLELNAPPSPVKGE